MVTHLVNKTIIVNTEKPHPKNLSGRMGSIQPSMLKESDS
jgi:hypothetical protein